MEAAAATAVFDVERLSQQARRPDPDGDPTSRVVPKVTVLTEELGELKARGDALGAELLSVFESIDRCREDLKTHGLTVEVRLGHPAIQEAYRHARAGGNGMPRLLD